MNCLISSGFYYIKKIVTNLRICVSAPEVNSFFNRTKSGYFPNLKYKLSGVLQSCVCSLLKYCIFPPLNYFNNWYKPAPLVKKYNFYRRHIFPLQSIPIGRNLGKKVCKKCFPISNLLKIFPSEFLYSNWSIESLKLMIFRTCSCRSLLKQNKLW